MNFTCPECPDQTECLIARRCREPSTVEAALAEVIAAGQDLKRASERLGAAAAAFDALAAIERGKHA